jgi:hypothetical protein
MAASRHDSVGTKVIANSSGQAALEFAIVATLILLLMFALVDFGRALNCKQVMIGLTRQGSNLASRGNTLSDSAAAVVAGDAPLDLSRNGEVIVTSVININKIYVITGQASRGGILQSSKIGPGVGKVATVPPAAANMLQTGQTIYVTEIFYSYQPITPIGNFMKIAIPSTLYEAAYF